MGVAMTTGFAGVIVLLGAVGALSQAGATIVGEAVCLPHRDTSGPQTMECAFGIRDDRQQYYALRDTDPAYRNVAALRVGSRVVVQGELTLQEDARYQSIGVIAVAGISRPPVPGLVPQAPPPPPLPPAAAAAAADELPVAETEGAWTLRVVSTGGFTGMGRGHVTLTSAGDLICSQDGARCTRRLRDAAFETLLRSIVALVPTLWTSPGAGACSDCFVTTVTLVRREGGNVKTFTATWDDATRSRAPVELVRVAEDALSLATFQN